MEPQGHHKDARDIRTCRDAKRALSQERSFSATDSERRREKKREKKNAEAQRRGDAERRKRRPCPPFRSKSHIWQALEIEKRSEGLNGRRACEEVIQFALIQSSNLYGITCVLKHTNREAAAELSPKPQARGKVI